MTVLPTVNVKQNVTHKVFHQEVFGLEFACNSEIKSTSLYSFWLTQDYSCFQLGKIGNK